MTSHATPEDDTPQEQQLELGEDDNAIALRKAWERTLRSLATHINRPTLDNWLRPLKPLSIDDSIVVLGAPTPFARQWVETKYAQPIQAALAQYLDRPDLQIRFVVSRPDVQPLLGEKPLPLQQAAAPAPTPPKDAGALSAPDSRNPYVFELAAAPLNEKYTFDNFVVGKSNRMAVMTAEGVAGSPGTAYNPLFIYGNPGLGKCVAASEYLPLADGRRVRAGDLVGTDFPLLTLAKEEIVSVPARAEFNAVEPVWAVQTESGRRIVRNAQHPLWAAQGIRRWEKNFDLISVRGWTPLSAIRPGDLVAVPECLPAFGNPVPLPDHEIKLLAYLIGDGGYTQPAVRFSQQDNAQLAEFKECIVHTNCWLIQHNKYDWRVVGRRGGRTRGADGRNEIMNLLRRHGLMGVHSRDKRIPEAVFRLPVDQLRLFLSRLFATDGWASCGAERPGNRLPRTEIGFCSASEGLIRDLQELLLKLGIVSHTSRKAKINAWTLAVHAAPEVLKFCARVGIYGKEEAVERVRQVAVQVQHTRPNRGLWRHRQAPAGMRWEKVTSIEGAGVEVTVAVEVPDYATFLSTFWEHNTHLSHAIGHQIRQNLPQARIAYVSGETFTNHYVAAIRDKRMEDFRRAYRTVDVWLIDDIQTIASREGTKEEFFHTFNALYQMNRQIVITSDRSPRDLRTMDERLRSRFEQGMFVDITAPDLEMRQAILQKKALLENMRIPDEVIAYMADLIQSNIRALEGALVKLMVYASVARSPVTKQLARDVLSSYFVERLPPSKAALGSAHPEDYPALPAPGAADVLRPTPTQVVAAVAAQFGITPEQILAGGGRSSRAGRLQGDPAFARQIAMYLAKELCDLPVTALADAFGCRNRTAVTHAHNRLREELETDAELMTTIGNIRKVIQYNLQ